jgi:hypothetical protein
MSESIDTSATVPVADQDLIESLVWISATSKPTWLYNEAEVAEEKDALIPENPLYYLWLRACHELNLLVTPLVPTLIRPKRDEGQAGGTPRDDKTQDEAPRDEAP